MQVDNAPGSVQILRRHFGAMRTPMTRLVSLALLVLCAAPTRAQQRPSFSGEWARVDSTPEAVTVARAGDARFRVGDMGSGWDSPLTIRQTQDSLFVEFQHFSAYDLQPKLHYAFALDGSETRNRVNIGNAETVLPARVRWNGSSLVIVTRFPVPPEVGKGATEVRQVLSVDEGGQLVMETTRPDVHGPNVVRTVFVRR